MRKVRRKLAENSTSPTPYGAFIRKNYQIAPAGPVVLDYSAHDKEAFVRRRELEQQAINQKSYMIGNLDNTENQIINLFKQISELKQNIIGYYDFPLITKHQKLAIKNIQNYLDKINTILTNDVLTNLDELGTAEQIKPRDL